MLEIFEEAILDSIKALPILFLVYLLIEFLEHKASIKFEKLISSKRKAEPLLGSIIGVIPQCGFAAIIADLFSRRIVTIGTLFAVFIATSDEAFSILLTHPNSFKNITILLLVKLVVAIICGYLIDLIIKNKRTNQNTIDHHDEHEHEHACDDCDHNMLHHKHELHEGDNSDGIFIEALKHTIQIFIIILISNLILGFIMYLIGEDNIIKFVTNNSYLQYILSPMIGLIPSCAGSVILVELYTTSIISFSSCIGGLITGSGVGLIVLFKRNKNLKENIFITISLYAIGLLVALLLSLFSI